MNVTELLRRYHIAPLKYEDGVELTDKDYFDLAGFLIRYFHAKKVMGFSKTPHIPDNLISRVERYMKQCLLDITIEDIMDILMEQKGGNVINETQSVE